jgi:hypothetical protein
MLAQPTRKPTSYLVPAAIVITLASVLAAPVAIARILSNTIDPVSTITGNGRNIIVTGPIRCGESQRAHIAVTVSQRSTGAIAEGDTQLVSTGETQHWEIRASTRGSQTFQEGPATAVALGRTTDRGVTDDAHQWLVNITLAAK